MNKNTLIKRLFASSALLTITAGGAWAGAGEDVNDRIDELERELNVLKSQVESSSASKTSSAVKFAPAPQWTSADGKYSFKVRGRIELDTAYFNSREGTHDFNDGTELRRARLGVEGTVDTDWLYRLEADFANADIDVKDAFLRYGGFGDLNLTLGQHKTPNSLERLTSSNYLTFLERSNVIEAFTSRNDAGGDYKAGISLDYAADHWTVAGGVFGENISVDGSGGADEGYGFHARGTVAPIHTDNALLHLGASGYWRSTGGDGAVRFRDRPEVRVDGTRFIDTGTIDADSYTFVGGEVIGALGPVFVQGEYARSGVNRDGSLADVNFDGFYVTAGWFLTGESLPYKNGNIARIKPKQNFSLSEGGWGAFELAARFSTLNLDDNDIQGGESQNYTVGLNWYANPYVRVQLNWVRFNTERAGVETDGDAVAARIGVNW